MPAIVCSRCVGSELENSIVVSSFSEAMREMRDEDIIDIEFPDDDHVVFVCGLVEQCGEDIYTSDCGTRYVLAYIDGSDIHRDFWDYAHEDYPR